MKMSLLTLEKLKEVETVKADEYVLIESLKCALLKNGSLDDYEIEGSIIECEKDACALEYREKEYHIEIKGNLIMDYAITDSW